MYRFTAVQYGEPPTCVEARTPALARGLVVDQPAGIARSIHRGDWSPKQQVPQCGVVSTSGPRASTIPAVGLELRRGDWLERIARVALVLGVLSQVGCAVSIGNEIGEAYTSAFRTEIVSAYALSAEEQQQLAHLQTYSVDTVPRHTLLGKLKGLSCRETLRWVPEVSELNGRTPEEVAMTQLRVKVVKAGGNAVLSPSCSSHSVVDWGNNCFASWLCTGEAILVEK